MKYNMPDQSEMMTKFLRILGMSLTIIFSIGAMIGATITMYAGGQTAPEKSAHCGRSDFSAGISSLLFWQSQC